MALPSTIDPTAPAETDNPAQGASQIRALKQYIIDVFGAPNAVAVTTAPFSITAGGLLSFTATPLTVPSMIQGVASTVLFINSQYSSIVAQVATQTIGSWTSTGLLLKQVFIEGATTMKIGTQNAQSLFFRSNALDRAVISPSGLLGIGQGSPLYPVHISSLPAVGNARVQLDDGGTSNGAILLGVANGVTALWVTSGPTMPVGIQGSGGQFMYVGITGRIDVNTPLHLDGYSSARLVLPVGANKYATL